MLTRGLLIAGEDLRLELTVVAMIGRLVHLAEILSFKGDSYRLRDKDLGSPPAGE
jgi:DNA replication protein DnaC